MTGDNALWIKIQQDYIETGTTYRELAEKYNVSSSTLRKKAASCNWKEKRKEVAERQRAEKKIEEQIKEQMEAERKPLEKVPVIVPIKHVERVERIPLDPIGDKERYAQLVDEMLNRVEDAICVVDVHNAASVKMLTAALKDLRELKNLNKTELDIEEQKARIAKLKSDTRIVETEESGGVVFMPVMNERPVPPEDER